MTRDDLDALIVQIGERLRQQGGDPAVAHALRRHEALYEVVGKWPPSTPPKATPAEVDQASGAVAEAIDALTKTPSSEPAIQTLETILQRLNGRG